MRRHYVPSSQHIVSVIQEETRQVRYLARPGENDECTKYYVLRVSRQLVRRDVGAGVILKWILRKY